MQLKLDLQFFAGEKTEKATPKRRQDEREKGKVAKSQDVNTAFILLFSFIILTVFGGFMKDRMTALYKHTFTEYINWQITEHTVPQLFRELTIAGAEIIAPVMLAGVLAAVAANLLQIGFLFTTESMKFDLKKIDPIQGAKRIFSIRALIELLKSLLKIVCIGAITFTVIWLNKDAMIMLAFKPVESSLAFFGKTTMLMGLAATIALIVLAAFDYAYQRYDFEKNMKMSKQDIKEEHKNMEGDPFIRSKRKEKQRQIAMSRMMSEVPKADVVITNPTHYAIAVKYDEEKAAAPYIIAKGTGYTALKIKELAKENHVITVENKPLARSLYGAVETGDLIPEQFYQAVAEILAYVYRISESK